MTESIQFTGRVTRQQYGDDPQPEGAGTLGKLRQTERGFEIITFHDRYNQACSLQQSSLAFESAIWLGISGNRMHLTEGHVMDLMERLSVWLLDDGRSFRYHNESIEDLPTEPENKEERPEISPEPEKRERDINRLKGIIKKLEMANQDIRAKTEERFEEDIECLKATNGNLEKSVIRAEQDEYRYAKIRRLQNAFVYSPLWRRLWIALFPVRHFK